MVKIQDDSGSVIEDQSSVAKNKRMVQRRDKEVLESSAASKLPEPNLELIMEARESLKREYESDLERSENIYSKPHYEELMDPGVPFPCWRYLLHCDRDVKQAVDLMKQTMIWRKMNRIDVMRPEDLIKDCWLRAPIGFVGKTRAGHDLVYAIGKNYRKPDSSLKRTIRDFIAFLLFDWDRRHKHDLKQMVVVFDVSDTSFRNVDLDFSAWLVSIRDYVPARVNAIYFIGIPYLIRPIIKIIISWLPERYRQIVHCGTFEELITPNIEPHNLPEEVGGMSDNTWRLAPVEARWAYQMDNAGANELFDKICQACSFNANQEQLDKLYQMQRNYDMKRSKIERDE